MVFHDSIDLKLAFRLSAVSRVCARACSVSHELRSDVRRRRQVSFFPTVDILPLILP